MNNKSFNKSYNKHKQFNNSNNKLYNKSNSNFINDDPLVNWKKKGSVDNKKKRWERVGYISREASNNINEE